jgi:replication factor A1
MHKTKDQLYELIKDLKTKNEFEDEIKKRHRECNGLIDEDTIALLIIDELGRNKQTISKIVDLKPDIDCTVFGTITGINNSKSFKRKNGSSGRVINLEISDETATCNLVLWNKDVELVKNKTIQKGTNIKIINGYTKEGYNGLEINLGRWGIIETEPEDIPHFKNNIPANNDFRGIKGTLTEIQPTRAFFQDSGEFGFVTTIKIREEKGVKQLTLWDEKVKEIQQFKIGDTIKIDDVDIKQNNDKTEIHVNSRSTIKKL